MYDFMIIGNGILGSSLAYFLKKREPKAKIALIGPSGMDGAASTTAGAMIAVWAELAPHHLEHEATNAKFEMAKTAGKLWEAFAEKLTEDSKFTVEVNRGTYLLLSRMSTSMEARAFEYIENSMAKLKEPFEIINPETIEWLKPANSGQPLRILKLNDGWVDSTKVISALHKACHSLGVDFLDNTVTSIASGNKGMFGIGKTSAKVFLDNGASISGDQVVFANGSFAQDLIDNIPELAEQTPRILYGAGAAIELSLPAWVKRYGGIDPKIREMNAVLRTVDRGGACGFHAIPLGDGEYYIGASSGVWMEHERHPRIHGIENLIKSTLTEFSEALFFSNIKLRGNGFRPTTIDCFPLLGQSDLKPFWFANGTKRDGFTMAPFIMDEMAKEMLGEKNNLPKMFKPSRPLISYLNKSQAIEEGKQMMIGADGAHGGNYPPYLSNSILKTRTDWVESVYEKRSLDEFGIHPEVLHFYDSDEFFEKVKHPMSVK